MSDWVLVLSGVPQ